ncbi:hypothetical protein QTI51_01820 [Variovorax sp. J22G73]|uniref:hypothetical protein n=1 Tax=unclassified Variovorax TaxID=663243 RepID=UPI000D5F124F|nr:MULTISPECIES: hypothetical protein [unclassified Variovorax]MDM0004338.1 hypothetical protein [Variovorax sp. J22R203]MDM0095996.1 hypothetical protein [Variovorax sp. J22G73]
MPTPSITLRAFGRAEDLDIPLDIALDASLDTTARADRPALVTQLLERCDDRGRAGDREAFWWSRPVGMRIGALLRLVALTEATDSLGVVLRCVQPDCGERFEIELPLGELAARAPDAPEAPDSPGSSNSTTSNVPLRLALPGGRSASLRLPTGNDLRDWATLPHAGSADAIAAVIASLRIDGDLQPGDAAALAEGIAAHDPLVAFSVASTCPACGAEDELPVDLEGLALQKLAQHQQRLVMDVHRLASRYGWTEQQALAVPPRRRERYLALIDNDAGDALP